MKIGIIGAMAVEVQMLKDIMQNMNMATISGIEYYSGTISGVEVVVAQAGIGKVNAAVCTEAMILKYEPAAVINIGVAGGLSGNLKVGDIAIADTVVEHDMDTSVFGDPIGFITGINLVNIPCAQWVTEMLLEVAKKIDGVNTLCGTIVSGDQFISSKEKKLQLVERFNAVATEMEGASIGHVCYMNGVPFGVLRAISDSADDEADMSFNEFCDMAAKNSSRVILNFLEIVKEKKI
ncbi:MAG: 5'-methylthioadenosine/adenosylhomocysteine nucleosidase [Ruminococcaceae bacterium]|nr:5'-methylthioadenosine/adenosylhomocysteine nucleosidase [Oscillospiraceae bacterium]